MDVDSARRSATLVGLGSGALGAALLVAPEEAGRLFGLSDDMAMRVIGVADLVLVPGLVCGRSRWRWVGARVALNLAIARFLLNTTSPALSPWRPLAAAVALAAVTVGDLRVGTVLYAARG